MHRPDPKLLRTALVCVFLAALAATSAAQSGNTWTLSSDFHLGVLDGVNATDTPDQLQLDRVPTTFPYAWIANSADGTVSKIDTRTGGEAARYRTGPTASENPSRTAVDIDGNCWVGNRNTGTVTKILLAGGIDRDGNGSIDTSTGPGDIKPWMQDERIVIHVAVGATSSCLPRAAAIDPSGRVWFGLYNESRYAVLDPATGAVLAYVPTSLRPYGAAVDGSGGLWNAGLGWGLERIDLVTMASTGAWYLGGGYGIAVDTVGVVWLGSYGNSGVYRFDPTGPVATYHPDPTGARAGRGVCVAANGNVWVAEGYGSPNTKVTKYAPSGAWLATYTITNGVSIGVNPNGVGVDSDGNIIVVCQDTDDVWKFRESDGTFMWRTPVGSGPYTYSDFTGFVIRNITQQTGTWTVVQDGGAPGMAWGTCSWNSIEPADTTVGVRVRAADVEADLATAPWLTVANGVLFGPINGRFLQIESRLTTQSDATPVLEDLTVEPYDTTPPEVHASAASVRLMSPSHNMVNVGLAATITDNMDPDPLVQVFIYGDEDDETPTGDGVFSPDALDIGLGTLRLRSERKGDSDGRVYLIVVMAIDDLGNIGFDCCTVVVPHSKSAKAIASVEAQAASTMAFCLANGGAPPPEYFVIGDGPVLGPKQ